MIAIRSSAMASFGMPELEILRADRSRSATPDQGLVYPVNRMKDMINRGGENAYCMEVENAPTGAPGSTRWRYSACPTR